MTSPTNTGKSERLTKAQKDVFIHALDKPQHVIVGHYVHPVTLQNLLDKGLIKRYGKPRPAVWYRPTKAGYAIIDKLLGD